MYIITYKIYIKYANLLYWIIVLNLNYFISNLKKKILNNIILDSE